MAQEINSVSADTHIIIQGARVHNLKNVNIAIPRNKFVVITGLSGSGKSSLAFDTLYAEGQRRYVESLSSYARQFLGKLDKPEVDDIKGLAPAIAIEQKVISRNPRSTVGTTTEIYDYLKVLYARVGRTYSPISGLEVKRHSVSDVLAYLSSKIEGEKFFISAPLEFGDRSPLDALQILHQQGFARVLWGNDITRIDDLLAEGFEELPAKMRLVIDRSSVQHNDEDHDSRMADSIQTAFYEGHGTCYITWVSNLEEMEFNNRFEADGMNFEEPSLHLFSFNNPYGACPKCEGFGNVIGIDEELVIPNQNLSLFEDCVVAWKGEKMQEWKEQFINYAEKYNFPIHRPYKSLTPEEKSLLWDGKGRMKGIHDFFHYLESKSYKIQYRVMLSRYRGKTLCPSCKGARLRIESSYVRIHGKHIMELVNLPITQLSAWFKNIELNPFEQKVAKRLLVEINNRLHYLEEVGLGYLTLNRMSATLSGGESQRINLATSLGSSLVGSMYILDEPSIGLHPRDTERLIHVIEELRDLGNTVIVVEHDEAVMKAADYIIDIGPGAGSHGGQIVFEGTYEELISGGKGYTAQYLKGELEIPLPERRRKFNKSIKIEGAREHNLKDITVEIPLGIFSVVTGASGSGKSTLIKKILYPAMQRKLGFSGERPGKHDDLTGAVEMIETLEFVDQNPIGKSSRSNPVTYLKAYDEIRTLYANQKLSQLRGFKTKHFSFNTDGGRCDVCKGEGEVTIEMQFMADVHLKCEQCNGKRFKEEVLEVTYEGKSIFDILEMTVDDAIEFFEKHKQHKIVSRIKPLQDVGLGYVHLGQSSSTLSGGEAQRVKLASFLTKSSNEQRTMFIFDEPTTGLHFDDINKLMTSFNALLDRGHTLVVIEHNPEVMKCADWIIDLGPDGGETGGNLIYQGTPEGLIDVIESPTAPALKEKLQP